MNSCLYRATVMHNRLQPKQHRFHYNVFMFYIDLDEIELLRKKLWMFSHNKFNFFSFRDKEHLQLPAENPDTTKNTKQHIIEYLSRNNININNGKIMLLTNLNVLGYNFNPVSFYFCFDENSEPLCCVAEVGNTFREMKPYLLTKENLTGNKYHLNTKKYFYVSPFIDHDTDFDFNLTIPEQKLNIKIDDYKNGERFFISTLTGYKKSLTNGSLFKYSLRFPFITLKVITLIHWNAVLLWMKKLAYHPKAANQHLQKDVYKRYKTKT
jgi:DUF1365 family protein